MSIDSGSVSATVVRRAIASSRGVQGDEETTTISGDVFGMAVEGDDVGSFAVEGWAQRRLAGFDGQIESLVDRFVETTLGALRPGKGQSYRGLVLFTPEAVSSLLVGNLVSMMSAPTLRKGKSPLRGRLGESIATAACTLTDDGTIAGNIGSTSFDREGLPHSPVTLLDKGTFSHVLYNHYEARAAEHAGGSTGHASGGVGSLPGVGTTFLKLAPGDTPHSELLANAGRVVVVTRFSGSTNNVTGDFSGVVKGGYLVSGGERAPITETLVAGNLLDVWTNVAAVSSDTKRIFGGSEMPWILADGVSVTAG